VRTLLQLPMHGAPWARWINRILLRWQLRRAQRTVAQDTPLVSWFVAPHVGSLIGTLGESRSVYYCVDDFSVFAGVDGGAVSAMDLHLTRQADLVFVSSATLLAEKRRLNPQVHHAPHGVEVAHFRQALDRGPTRPDGFPNSGPVIGYFGLIAEWIDLGLIDRLAARHPEWQFVMIGRIAVAEGSLPARANIHFLGPKPYTELPHLGAWFDVAIIPYRLTQQVLRANPIKLREYIAMEKPIVAVDTPDIRSCEALVTIASSDSEWSDALTASLAAAPDVALVARQRAAAEDMTWQSRMTAVAAQVFGGASGSVG
jgi:glycosyltransferase involved in cell wall biosynthesis